MPTAAGSSPLLNPLTDSGSASSDGMMTRSSDGRYLIVPGYAVAPGTASITGTRSATIPRGVGVVAYDATIDTTTTANNAFDSSNIRSATSTDGNSLWISGDGSGTGGGNVSVRYLTKGSTASTAIAGASGTTPNGRDVSIYFNQLYLSSSATTKGIFTVGSGTPTTSSQTLTALTGIPAASEMQYVILHVNSSGSGADTIYYCDDTANTIAKYYLNGSTWTAAGSVTLTGAAGLTAIQNGTTVALYATAGSAASNSLYSITDSSGFGGTLSGTPTAIGSAGANKTWRGVALAPVAYTVTYNANGGTGSQTDGSSPYAAGATVNVKDQGSITRTGYTFAGWTTASDGSGTVYGPSYTTSFTINANTTLYAQWSIVSYTLSYSANGGTGTDPSSSSVQYNSSVTTAANPYTRTGYTFAGWTTNADGSGTVFSVGGSFNMPAANTTVYAKWTVIQYTLGYDANGGTGTAPGAVTVDYNSAQTSAAANTFTRSGFTFTGWNTAAAGNGTPIGANTGFNMPAANTTLYAQWSSSAFNIVASAGANGTVTPSGTTAVSSGGSQTYTIAGNAGYDVADVLVDTVSVGAVTTYTFSSVAAAHTISATFSPKSYTVTFDPQNGTVSPTTKNVTYASTYGTLPTPTRTGYTFNGWFIAPNGTGGQVIDTTPVTITAAQTLYASWTAINYILSYDAGTGGSGTPPSSVSVAYNSSTTAAANTFTRTGYTFSGWNTSVDGSGQPVAAGGSFTMLASDTTLYAQWTINTYTVTYNNNTGTGIQSDINSPYNYNSTVTVLNQGTMAKTGNTFSSWNTAANGSGTAYAVGATINNLAANVILYAQWTVNNYDLSYDANGGSGTAPSTVTVNYGSSQTAATANTFTRSGYVFTGWNTAANGSGTAIADGANFNMPGANTTLYAQWTHPLAAGDLAIVAINTSTIDSVGVVALVDLAAGDKFNLTDNGWLAAGGFRIGEGILTYTVPAGGITKGTMLVWTNGMTIPGSGLDSGWSSATPSGFNLNAGGESVILYIGTLSNPTLIYAAQTGDAWDADASSTTTSAEPTSANHGTLVSGVTTFDTSAKNGYYSGTTVSGTKSQILAAIQPSAWTTSGNFTALSSWKTAASAAGIFTILTPQTITFNSLAAVAYGDADFTLTGSSDSGLTVTYTSSDLTVATISGATVHILKAGTTTITASQAGNGTYAAATPVAQILTVNAGVSVPNLNYTNAPGQARFITLVDIQAAGLSSSQGSPSYAITGVNSPISAAGTVIFNSSNIKYTSPSGSPASDSFSYTVSDGTSSRTATVSITFASVSGPQITPTVDGANHPVIGFHGLPGYSYHIQRATTLANGGDWTPVQAVSLPSDGDGSYSWTDTDKTVPPDNVYYRLSYP